MKRPACWLIRTAVVLYEGYLLALVLSERSSDLVFCITSSNSNFFLQRFGLLIVESSLASIFNNFLEIFSSRMKRITRFSSMTMKEFWIWLFKSLKKRNYSSIGCH
ncbi:hypothetical protein AABB24_007418 [Solanum stoloniferum]|uniref:Secreted protein n=1 Tax=Solanum stoloniferum TaxID=62892 RepID=A0ABD2UPF7_9SOLN